jgi:hypothetical protein
MINVMYQTLTVTVVYVNLEHMHSHELSCYIYRPFQGFFFTKSITIFSKIVHFLLVCRKVLDFNRNCGTDCNRSLPPGVII